MKKVILIAIFFIFISIFQQSSICSFGTFEDSMVKNNTFVENGIKVIYDTTNSPKDEIDRIIKQSKAINVVYNNNIITFEDEEFNYSLTIWCDTNTKVSIQVINKEKMYFTKDILNKINKFVDEDAFNLKIYEYLKVKLESDITEAWKFVNSEVNIENDININNGRVIKGSLADGTNVNIAHMKYDTGNYLIIGSPVIFVTY